MLDNNRIARQIEEYIAYKQSLGYMIKIESQELRRFAKYTREIGYNGSITAELAMQWASLDSKFSRIYMARRLETIHTFAVYISSFDTEAQIPQNGVFGKAHMRVRPHIYSDDEVLSLMSAAYTLFSPDGIRARTVSSAIGLMYSSGIRVSELTSLRIANVRLDEGYLLANFFETTIDYLVGNTKNSRKIEPVKEYALNTEEQKLVDRHRALRPNQRQSLSLFLDTLEDK